MANSPLPTCTHYVFRTNSLFDPNFSSTGHQPMGFDEMMQLFQVYSVYQCDVIVTVLNGSATAVVEDRMTVGARFTQRSAGFSTVGTSIIEYGGSRYIEQDPISGIIRKIRMSIKPWKQVPQANFKSENNQGTAAANPLSPSYLDIWKYNSNPLLDAAALTIRVQLDFTTKFFSPVELVAS